MPALIILSEQADPGEIAVQSHLICAPRLVIAEKLSAFQNGGDAR
jgi:hypothetical protein